MSLGTMKRADLSVLVRQGQTIYVTAPHGTNGYDWPTTIDWRGDRYKFVSNEPITSGMDVGGHAKYELANAAAPESAAADTSNEERVSIALEVREQGAPIVNIDSAHLHAGDGTCVAIMIDMRSKRCDVVTADPDENGIPVVYLQATDGSMHLDESKHRDSFTVIALPEFKGWSFFHAEGGGRYTVRLVLTKGADGVDFPALQDVRMRRPSGTKIYTPQEAFDSEIFAYESNSQRLIRALLREMNDTQKVDALTALGWVKTDTKGT